MLALTVVFNYLCCLLFALALMRRMSLVRETPYVEWFEAFVAGSLLYSAETFVFVEILSLFNLLGTPEPLAACYFGAVILFSFFIFRWRTHLSQSYAFWKTAFNDRMIRRACYFIAFLIILPLLFIAVYYPPCTADSMSYHLPRILHWIQNGNVAAYPTNYIRQLFVQPFGEYLILPWELFTGGDYFDNTIQIVALIGILLLTALLIRHFGGGAWCQLLGIAVLLSSPIVIFEAPTTQTDLIVTFFFFSFLYSGLKLGLPQNDKGLLFYALCMGVSLGLSLNTKVSVAVFELPFCFWFGWRFFSVHRRRVVPIYGILIAGFLFFNAPYFTRNIQLTGDPFGPKEIQLMMRNLRFGPDVVLSNAIRNIGMQLLTPVAGINHVNFWLVTQTHEVFGMRWGDPETTFTGEGVTPYPYEPVFILDDYRSGNTLIILLLFIVSFSLGGAALKRYLLPVQYEKNMEAGKRKKADRSGTPTAPSAPGGEDDERYCLPTRRAMHRDWVIYAWLTLFGFLLFCGLFRWQPFGTRLLLPAFLGSVPVIAIGLCRILEPKRIGQMSALTLGISLLYVIFITSNSLFYNPLEALLDLHETKVETEGADGSGEKTPSKTTTLGGELVDVSYGIQNIELLDEYFRPNRTFVERFHVQRNYNYFRTIRPYLVDYLSIGRIISELDIATVGLALDPLVDRWEYPFWPIIRMYHPKVRIKWIVFPEYHKKTYNYDPDFVPDIIITDYLPERISKEFEIEHAWTFNKLILAKVKKEGDEKKEEPEKAPAESETPSASDGSL